MSGQDLQCCLCNCEFTSASHPRMMPSCEHSACSLCLKPLIAAPSKEPLVCRHCGHQENIQEADLEYFPKNISLTKVLKEREQSALSPISQQSSQIKTQPQPSTSQKPQFCTIHNKELEIICLTDWQTLCPHCALFGKHKNHPLKAIPDAEEEMKERREAFRTQLKKKELIMQQFEGNQFKQNLISKINTEKERVILEIRAKFSNLQDNIKLAERQAYDDLSKHYKHIYKKIASLLKEQKQSQVRFKDWQQRCSMLIAQAETKQNISEKVSLYYGGPLDNYQDGERLLIDVERKMKADLAVIEKLICSVRTSENREVSNSIFNYLNVFEQTSDIDVLSQFRQEVIEPKKEIYESPKFQDYDSPKKVKLQFSSAQSFDLMKTQSVWSQSNNRSAKGKRHTTPQRKSSSKEKKLNKTVERRKVGKSPQSFQPKTTTVQNMVEQFISRENLDTLDLTGYSLSDYEIVEVLKYIQPLKKIKGLKLVKNNLTNDGLSKIVQFIPNVSNLNLSFNSLGEQALTIILSHRQQLPILRIINISNNKINERKAKATVEELKRQGIIVTT